MLLYTHLTHRTFLSFPVGMAGKVCYNRQDTGESDFCNCCGKSMKIQNGMLLEGICSVDTTWGYFSGKDLEKHEFDLCEECYDRITLSFAVPPEISEDTEV